MTEIYSEQQALGSAPASTRAASQVFVGGSGSSGTTITARLIGHHPRFAFIPAEINFHADPNGLRGLLAGRIPMAEFQRGMRDHHYRYLHHSSRDRGIHRLIDEDGYEAALTAFDQDFSADRYGASRRLIEALLAPYAQREGKPAWVEMTPRNAVAGSTLHSLFPDMRLVHSVRDGRDVATDKVYRRGMKVADAFEALEWWGLKIRRAGRQHKRLGDRMLAIRMEDLVRNDREATYQRLLEFLGVEDHPTMSDYFAAQVRPERANIDTWRELLPLRDVERFDARYRALVGELIDEGVECARLVVPADGLSAPTRARATPRAADLGATSRPASEPADRIRVDPRLLERVEPAYAASLTAEGGSDESRFADLGIEEAFVERYVHYRSWAEIGWARDVDPERLEIIDRAYESIKSGGYRAQDDLVDGRVGDEMQVVIDGEGRLFLAAGAHRLAIARLLGIAQVPVLVAARDRAWLEFVDEVLTYADSRRGRVYQLIDHPDLVDLPAYHKSGRFEVLADALAGYDARGKKLLDIGTHWGYMPQQFERRFAFRCTGVEHNRTCIEMSRKICTATDGRYEIWGGSIFDFPRAEEQDVVLALNVFNHFIKTPENHANLVRFLNRLEAEIIFFEPHLADQPGKMPEDVYRNYQPVEFAEFVAGEAGMTNIEYLGVEPDHYSHWKRPIYKITR